jgi:thymidine phosphorylase
MKKGLKIINSFLKYPTETTMSNLLSYATDTDLSDQEIIVLARGLANSGERIILENTSNSNISDIASTGGPSSLSTLICPLYLRLFGNIVLKLGVPGRPAGGIDVLAQIYGYNIKPDLVQLHNWIKENRYVHFLSSKNYAPLDKLLFDFRKKKNMLDNPSLVIASLLSKKIAVGLNTVGLDIRVSDFGNFGKNWDQARINGARFIRIANSAGIRAKCFLTDGNSPQQPYIGRGEAILALQKIFSGCDEPYLKKHIEICFEMAKAISMDSYKEDLQLESLRDIFYKNVNIQGGSIQSFTQIAESIENSHQYKIHASKDGILSINLEMIRSVILKNQLDGNKIFPDSCGIILKVMSNEHVNKGDVICSFRCAEQITDQLEHDLLNCFVVTSKRAYLHEFEEII